MFFLSVGVAVATILVSVVKFRLGKTTFFFAFFPLLFIYLGFISFVLSPSRQLTGTNFLFVQWILLNIALVHAYINGTIPAIAYKKWITDARYIAASYRASWRTNLSWILITLLIGSSFLLRIQSGITNIDDRLYRAPAPHSWINFRSVFRFETLEERKDVFVMGTGLIYMWPHLFAAGQQTAQAFYWFAFPLSVIGIALLSRLLTQNTTTQAITALLFTSAPIVMNEYTYTLTQESWLGLLTLSFGYFALLQSSTAMVRKILLLLLGAGLGVMLFIKHTAIAYLLTLPILVLGKNDAGRRLSLIGVGLIVSLLISGYVVLMYQNAQRYGTMLGGKEFRTVHMADLSLIQIRTHLARMPFIFMWVPPFPPGFTRAVEQTEIRIADFVGAATILPYEAELPMIGTFPSQLSRTRVSFGPGGVVWIFLFLLAPIGIVVSRGQKRVRHVLVGAILLVIMVQIITVRWMELSSVPYRHLISTFALICGLLPVYIEPIFRRLNPYVSRLLVGVLIIYAGYAVGVNVSMLHLW